MNDAAVIIGVLLLIVAGFGGALRYYYRRCYACRGIMRRQTGNKIVKWRCRDIHCGAVEYRGDSIDD